MVAAVAWPMATMPSKRSSPLSPGDINCRQWARTYDDVNYYTCYELAEKYELDIDKLFLLNPGLDKDCSNVQPNVLYCVAGCRWPILGSDTCSHGCSQCD